MICAICDQKTINCDCTDAERRMHAEIEGLQEQVPRWIPVGERLPTIAPDGVSVTVIAAHVGYDLTMQGFARTGELRSSPAAYIGSDEKGPWFESMVNGRRLEVAAWMPLPEPPTN